MPTTSNEYHWKLTNVYPSLESEEFKAAKVSLGEQIAALSAFMDEHRISGLEEPAQDSRMLAESVEFRI